MLIVNESGMKKSVKDTPLKKNKVKTPITESKVKKTPKKLSSESTSVKKNVRFDCQAKEKEHVKYMPTPFSSASREGKAKKKLKNIANVRKLSFDVEDISTEVKEPKKRKLEAENSSEASQVKKKKKKDVDTEKASAEAESEVNESNFELKNSDKKDRTIFVGNLPSSYDHKKVQKLFNRFGPVETVSSPFVLIVTVHYF